MHRVSVVGSSGSGKTRVAKEISSTLGVPALELDEIYHQAGWTPLPDDEFRARVVEFAEQGRWVIDGNYNSHGALDAVWQRADTVVWLDPPKWLVMWQVTARTLRRAATREELWNGNREPWSNLYHPDPEENVIRWAWTRFDSRRARYEERMREARWSHLEFIRLCSRTEQRDFLDNLAARSNLHHEARWTG